MPNLEKQKLAAHLISEIQDHMSDEDYQREFFESLTRQFETKEYLSEKQMDCLQRMYERVTA